MRSLGALLLLLAFSGVATAQPRLPEDRSFPYTSLFDSSAVELVFAAGTVDSALVGGRLGVREATWVGGQDDGLIWYLSESDTLDLEQSAILFHGFSRPGWTGFFDPPYVWIPASADLAVGYGWDWEGTDTLGAPGAMSWEVEAFESLRVPRGSFECWKLVSLGEPPVAKAGYDLMGRRLLGTEPGGPRWFANEAGSWLLVQDDQVVFGYGAVRTENLSWGRLKALYEP